MERRAVQLLSILPFSGSDLVVYEAKLRCILIFFDTE